jgi:hypothetical protein
MLKWLAHETPEQMDGIDSDHQKTKVITAKQAHQSKPPHKNAMELS